jgi:serine/threonine protein kinase
MSYAHEQNIIHRDLKSANILIDANGNVNIVDFGISLFTDTMQTQSDVSTRCFTLDIASPEQIQGLKIDARSDVFSLGALLLELLSGKMPLPKVNLSSYKPIEDQKHVEKVLKSVDFDSDLRNIISTAMHIDIEKRYQSMKEFEIDLSRYLNRQPVKATKDTWLYRGRKLMERNPGISALSFVLVLVSVLAIVLLKGVQQEQQVAEQKSNQSLAFIDALFEQADPFKGGNNSKELVKTLESIELSQSDQLTSNPEFGYHFYENMTEIYSQNANYVEALKSKRKSIEALKTFVEADDPKMISREIEVSQLLNSIGEYSQSITQSKRILDNLLENPNANPDDILISYVTLSRSHGALSQLDEEVRVHKKAIKFMDENPELNPDATANLLSSMAISQYRNGNKALANDLFERTIRLYKTLPNRQKSLVATLRNYAATQVNYGNFEKAEELFKESVHLIKRVDPRHPTLASTYLRYASLLAKSKRLDQAQELLNTAVEIFIEANDEVELSIAYGYLAELALRKNQISEAIQHVLSANQYMFQQQGLDHPKTLKKYNISLWILLIDDYKQQANELMEYLNATDYINSKYSKEYQILQIQKALLNGDVVSNKQSESALSHFLNSMELQSDEEKINWLKSQLLVPEEHSPLVHAFMNVWLLEFQPNRTQYDSHCLDPSLWEDTTKLVLKMDLMSRCLSLAERYGYEKPKEFEGILSNLGQQIIENKSSVEILIKALMQPKVIDSL